MKPGLLVLFFLLLSLSADAQILGNENTLLSSARAPTPEESGVSIHIMPLSLFNNPSRIRLGAQYWHKRFSYLLDVEYGADKLRILFDEDSDPDYRFYGFRPELRYDLNWKKGGYYIGLELPFTLKYSSHRGHLVDDNDNAFFVNYALERRLRVSGIFKIGRQLIAFRHFVFDGYVGIGGVYRNLDFRRLENIGPIMEEGAGYTTKFYGEEFVQEFALGLRLGYWFPVD